MSSFSLETIDKLLADIGLNNYHYHYESVFNNFCQHIKGTQLKIKGLHTEKYFDCFDSRLNQANCYQSDVENGFVVDFGGTNTRIVHFDIIKGNFICKSVDKFLNDKLINHTESKDIALIEQCFDQVITKILSLVSNKSDQVKAVSIIWSNAATSHKLSNGISGVTNKVLGIGNGKDYLKNEWFIKNLKNGDDLGLIFLDRCKLRNINLQKLIMGNDTVFVGLASVGASAAGVISTGANMATVFNVTCANSNVDRWFNLECGTNFHVDNNVVSSLEVDQVDLSIQSLIAGGWIVDRYINILSQLLPMIGCSEKISLSPDISKAKLFNNLFESSKLLEKNNFDYLILIEDKKVKSHLNTLFNIPTASPASCYLAVKLSNAFALRIIALSSAMIAGSVVNYSESAPQKVLMDSRVLEGLDPELNVLKKNLSALGRSKLKVELIKEDSNGIGAGILGAANSLAI